MNRLVDRYLPLDPDPTSPTPLVLDQLTGSRRVLKLAEAGSPQARALAQEAEVLADLAHPSLVQLTDRFDDVAGFTSSERVSGLATAWIPGRTLAAALRDSGVLERMTAFGRLVDAVAYLHRRGVLHLDLKPANAVLGPQGPVLLDLGSARSRHAGPEVAGGTLAYVAPEILDQQAASTAADIYSLGVLLFEILAGHPLQADEDSETMRREILAGRRPPLPGGPSPLPAGLVDLVDRMLALDPAGRPPTIEAVRVRLAALGFPAPSDIGAPPFVGREAEQRSLERALEQTGQVALVGAPGSGRSRLVRRHHFSAGVPDRALLDLTRTSSRVELLDRLCTLASETAPRVRVYLGRRERADDAEIRALTASVPALLRLGHQVVWACPEAVHGWRAVRLGALTALDCAGIAAFAGTAPGPRLRSAATRAAGQPGPLLSALGATEPATHLGPDPRRAAEVLATLPSPIPAELIARLPSRLQEQLPRLIQRCLLRPHGDGALVLLLPGRDAEIHPELLPALHELLDQEDQVSDPLWTALVRARTGDLPGAAAGFERAVADAGDRRQELLELATRLVRADHRPAVEVLAGLHSEDGDWDRAHDLLQGLADPTPGELRIQASALRRSGSLAEALALAAEHAARTGAPELWVELARCRLAEGDLGQAEHILARLDVGGGEPLFGAVLALKLAIAVRRIDAGETPPGLETLLLQVEDLVRDATLSAASLSAAGRILTRLGELERGQSMLAEAARRADRSGDVRRAAGVRLNRGNVLQKLGRGDQAREAYEQALAIARRSGDRHLLMRLSWSLAELELRARNLPEAEVHLQSFRRQTSDEDAGEVGARVSLLEAGLALAKGDPAHAAEVLQAIDPEGLPAVPRLDRTETLSKALLALSRPRDALATLEAGPVPSGRSKRALFTALRGRAHLALGREALAEALAEVPPRSDPLTRFESGEVLLAAAGEDLDPGSFAERRFLLDQAAGLLGGTAAARAATLRDRLVDAPAGSLTTIVALTEAMQDPVAFPGALARVVSEALGAHRVLIMARIPGLGRQVTYSELTGAEAAGIGSEVLRRIRSADDYWLAGDAFADPGLRESSDTVRTFEIRSLLAVAISREGQDEAVGALYVDDLHRTHRFGPDDVVLMQRLARAVGQMLPWLPGGRRTPQPVEPQEVLGVLLAEPRQVQAFEDAVQMVSLQRESNLLLTGPTGAGKTWFAERLSREVLGLTGVESVVLRPGDPQMLVTQLIGARRGEFTGAQERGGAIQRALARRKALFLDEVQALDDQTQQILLPLLDIPGRRFGGLTSSAAPLTGPLHVILGTNQDVDAGRWQDHFRPDLWYRMCRARFHLPPLVERGPEVVYRYLATMLRGQGATVPEEAFEPAALQRVTGWHWPGNLRQLHAFSERAAHRLRQAPRQLSAGDLPGLGLDGTPEPELHHEPEGRWDAGLRSEVVLAALRQAGWVQSRAAQALGMTPSGLNKFLKRHGLREEVRARRAAKT